MPMVVSTHPTGMKPRSACWDSRRCAPGESVSGQKWLVVYGASEEKAASLGTSGRPNAALALGNAPLLHLVVRRKRFANTVMELVVSLHQTLWSGPTGTPMHRRFSTKYTVSNMGMLRATGTGTSAR